MKYFLITILSIMFSVNSYADYNNEVSKIHIEAEKAALELHNELITNQSNSEIKQQLDLVQADGFVLYKKSEIVSIRKDCGYFGARGYVMCEFDFEIQTTFRRDDYLYKFIKITISWTDIFYSDPVQNRYYKKPILKSVSPLQNLKQPLLLVGDFVYSGGYEILNPYEVIKFKMQCPGVRCLSDEQKKYADKLKSAGYTCTDENTSPHEESPWDVNCRIKIASDDLRLQPLARAEAITKVAIGKPKEVRGPLKLREGGVNEFTPIWQEMTVFQRDYEFLKTHGDIRLNYIFEDNKPNVAQIDRDSSIRNPKRYLVDMKYTDSKLINYTFRYYDSYWRPIGPNSSDDEKIGYIKFAFDAQYRLEKITE